jgi:sarcosine oxidase
MPPFYDVIILGVGSMGSAAAYHLAKRGQRVLGLEQFSIPHSQGSHHGFSRMIRLAYFEHPDYVALLKQ